MEQLSVCLERNGRNSVALSSFSLNIVHPRTLRRGKHRLILWPDREADGAMESTTPSKMSTRDEMGRLEKVIYDTEPSIFSSLSEQSYVIARQKI